MAVRNLLYKKEIPINQFISIQVPSVGEILDNEDDYYDLVALLTAMPIDMMVQLDDAGIDFSAINEYELFLLLFEQVLKHRNTTMIFGGLNLKSFETAINEQNGNIILLDRDTGVRIDRALHGKIADTLREIHHLEKNNRKPANGEAMKFMIKRARDKMKRKKKETSSQLENLITAMVNTEQFKYDFENVKSLSIYQFNESVRQIIKKVDYGNKMHGIYSGTVSAKDLSQDDLNWLIH